MITRPLFLTLLGVIPLITVSVFPLGISALAEETNSVATPGTNAPAVAPISPKAATTNTPGRMDFSSFKVIAERNIFDPNRTARSRGGPVEAPKKVVKHESFSLVGVISYSKGDFAFFDGSSSSFKKVIKPEDSIAGYRVTEIAQTQVKLTADGKTIVLPVGSQMRRQDDGPWELSAATKSVSSETSSASSSPASSDAEEPSGSSAESEILKRLMQKREKESKNE